MSLPKLKVQYFKDGQPDGIKELDDPREGYCRAYNALWGDLGRSCEPLPVLNERAQAVRDETYAAILARCGATEEDLSLRPDNGR